MAASAARTTRALFSPPFHSRALQGLRARYTPSSASTASVVTGPAWVMIASATPGCIRNATCPGPYSATRLKPRSSFARSRHGSRLGLDQRGAAPATPQRPWLWCGSGIGCRGRPARPRARARPLTRAPGRRGRHRPGQVAAITSDRRSLPPGRPGTAPSAAPAGTARPAWQPSTWPASQGTARGPRHSAFLEECRKPCPPLPLGRR